MWCICWFYWLGLRNLSLANVEKKNDIDNWWEVMKSGTASEHTNILTIITKTITYPDICAFWRKYRISPHSWCSLNIFCRVCCLEHISQNGSGSLQVLQKCVALTCTFSYEQGMQSISFSNAGPTLKQVLTIQYMSIF